NSVVQHFPSLEYLLAVLAGALGVLAPGGALFVGDVRSLPLLTALHTSVRLAKAPAALSTAELARQIRRQVGREPELLLDPALFAALRERLPGAGRAWAFLKHGRTDNELNRFRFDALVEVAEV